MSDNVFTTEAQLLRGKIESVAGTAETLADTDGDVRVRNIEWTNEVEFDNESAKYKTGDHTHDEAIAGIARGTITGDIKLASGEFHYDNSGTDNITDSRLPYSKYLQACGLGEAITTPTDENTEDGSWSFIPNKGNDSNTITSALYEIQSGPSALGIEGKLAGAMGTFTLGADGVGKPFMFNFTLSGKIDGVTEVANVNLPVFDDDNALSTVASKFLNTVVSVEEVNQDGSDASNTPVEFCVDSFTLDPQNTLGEIKCQADDAGIKHMTITGRDPRLTITPLLKATSDFDYWTGITDMKIYTVTITNTNSQTGNVFSVTVPRAQMITASGSDVDGFRRNELTFRPLRNTQGATAEAKENDYAISIGAVNVVAV